MKHTTQTLILCFLPILLDSILKAFHNHAAVLPILVYTYSYEHTVNTSYVATEWHETNLFLIGTSLAALV